MNTNKSMHSKMGQCDKTQPRESYRHNGSSKCAYEIPTIGL